MGSPVDTLSNIYTDNSQSDKMDKNDTNCIIFSAKSSEKARQRRHFNILPPSRESSWMRLKIERQSERIEKGKRKFW